jgi:hypothetical protein
MRLNSCLAIFCLSFVAGPIATAQAQEIKSPSVATASGIRRAARDQEKRVLHSLFQRIEIDADDEPLKDVLVKISHLTDREILVDVNALADEGISTDQNVSFSLGEMTVLQVFQFLLEPLQLTWVANDGVLEITTLSHAESQLETRIYDVRRLCQLLEPLTKDLRSQFARKQMWQGQNPEGSAVEGGGIGGGGFFSIPQISTTATLFGQMGSGGIPTSSGKEVFSDGLQSVESLLAGLISSIPAMKWKIREGEGGSIQVGQGCLIVSQTCQGQLQVAGLLQAFERFIEGKSRAKSLAACRTGYPVDEDSAIFEALARTKNFEIVDEELKTVLGQIKHDFGIRVMIDVAALADEGISQDQNVNLKLSKLPLGICLKKILDPLQLTYVVQEGVLKITTQSKAGDIKSVRLYDISGCRKISKDTPDWGLVHSLTRMTSSDFWDGDSFAALISSKHLLVFHSQQVQSEIESLIEDLSVDAPATTVEPDLQLKVYTAPDLETATDLTRVLPQIVGNWQDNGTTAVGSINQVGKSLLIRQTSAVHFRVEEIMSALTESHRRQNPVVNTPSTTAGQPAAAKP